MIVIIQGLIIRYGELITCLNPYRLRSYTRSKFSRTECDVMRRSWQEARPDSTMLGNLKLQLVFIKFIFCNRQLGESESGTLP